MIVYRSGQVDGENLWERYDLDVPCDFAPWCILHIWQLQAFRFWVCFDSLSYIADAALYFRILLLVGRLGEIPLIHLNGIYETAFLTTEVFNVLCLEYPVKAGA